MRNAVLVTEKNVGFHYTLSFLCTIFILAVNFAIYAVPTLSGHPILSRRVTQCVLGVSFHIVSKTNLY